MHLSKEWHGAGSWKLIEQGVFIVSMSLPDVKVWRENIGEHIVFLQSLVENGSLHAAGEIFDAALARTDMIIRARDRAGAEAIVANTLYCRSGVFERLQIKEWTPFVGMFANVFPRKPQTP